MSKPKTGAQMTDISTIADTATQNFASGQYDDCLQNLRQLSKLTDGNDPRVENNIIVAEYYADGARLKGVELADRFEKVLKLQSLEEERRGSDGSDASRSSTNKGKGVASRGGTPVNKSTVTYNKAVALYHANRYFQAAAALPKMLMDVETGDPYLALRGALLAIDCMRQEGRLDLAKEVVKEVGRAFSQRDDTKEAWDGRPIEEWDPKVRSRSKSGEPRLASASEGTSPTPTVLDAMPKSYRAVDQLLGIAAARTHVLEGNASMAIRNLHAAAGTKGLYIGIVGEFLKTYLNWKTNAPPQHIIDHLNDILLLQKEALRRLPTSPNHPTTTFTQPDDPNHIIPFLELYYFNAMGCLSHRDGNHAMATLFFSKALNMNEKCVRHLKDGMNPKTGNEAQDEEEEEMEEWEKLAEELDVKTDKPHTTAPKPDPIPPHLHILFDQTPEIAYNAGLQLLSLGKYSLARTCFTQFLQQDALRSHHDLSALPTPAPTDAPRYLRTALAYLRIGECNLHLLRESDSQQPKIPPAPRTIRVGSYELIVPVRSREIATQQTTDLLNQALQAFQSAVAALPVPPHRRAQPATKQVDRIWSQATVGMSYVYLRMGIPEQAFSTASAVLDREGADEAVKRISRLYMRIAEVMLGKPVAAKAVGGDVGEDELSIATRVTDAFARCVEARVGGFDADVLDTRLQEAETALTKLGNHLPLDDEIRRRGMLSWCALARGDKERARDVWMGGKSSKDTTVQEWNFEGVEIGEVVGRSEHDGWSPNGDEVGW